MSWGWEGMHEQDPACRPDRRDQFDRRGDVPRHPRIGRQGLSSRTARTPPRPHGRSSCAGERGDLDPKPPRGLRVPGLRPLWSLHQESDDGRLPRVVCGRHHGPHDAGDRLGRGRRRRDRHRPRATSYRQCRGHSDPGGRPLGPRRVRDGRSVDDGARQALLHHDHRARRGESDTMRLGAVGEGPRPGARRHGRGVREQEAEGDHRHRPRSPARERQ